MGFWDSSGNVVLDLELVYWRKDLFVSAMEKRVKSEDENERLAEESTVCNGADCTLIDGD